MAVQLANLLGVAVGSPVVEVAAVLVMLVAVVSVFCMIQAMFRIG